MENTLKFTEYVARKDQLKNFQEDDSWIDDHIPERNKKPDKKTDKKPDWIKDHMPKKDSPSKPNDDWIKDHKK